MDRNLDPEGEYCDVPASRVASKSTRLHKSKDTLGRSAQWEFDDNRRSKRIKKNPSNRKEEEANLTGSTAKQSTGWSHPQPFIEDVDRLTKENDEARAQGEPSVPSDRGDLPVPIRYIPHPDPESPFLVGVDITNADTLRRLMRCHIHNFHPDRADAYPQIKPLHMEPGEGIEAGLSLKEWRALEVLHFHASLRAPERADGGWALTADMIDRWTSSSESEDGVVLARTKEFLKHACNGAVNPGLFPLGWKQSRLEFDALLQSEATGEDYGVVLSRLTSRRV